MILKEIHITAFRGLKNESYLFAPGVNLIEGENESGKSSIAAFLKYLFYGLSGSAPKGTLSEKAKSIPFAGGGVGGSLILEKGGKEYRVERRSDLLAGGGLREVCRVIDLQSGEICKEEPGSYFFGLPEKLFSHSVYHSGGELTVGGAAMEEAMENLLFSADEQTNVRRALKRLDEARILIFHKNGKGGKLCALEAEEQALQKRLLESERIRESIEDLDRDCAALRVKLEQDSLELAHCERQIAYTDAAVRLGILRRLKKAKEDLAAARQREKAYRQAKEQEGFFPTRDYEAMLVKMEGEYFEREKERTLEEGKLRQAEKALALTEGETRSSAEGEALLEKAGGLRRKARALGIIAGIFLLLLALPLGFFAAFGKAAFLGNFLSDTGLFLASGVTGVLGGVFALFSMITGKRRRRMLRQWDRSLGDEEALRALLEELREHEKERVRASAAVELQSAALAAAEEKCLRVRREAGALAEKWGWQCAGPEDLPKVLGAVREALSAFDALHEATLQAEAVMIAAKEQGGSLYPADLSDGQREAEEEKLRALLAELAEQMSKDDGMPPSPLGHGDYAALQKRCNFYKQTTAALREKLREGQTRLAALQAGMEDPALPRAALAALRQEKKRLRQLHDAYKLAYEKLEEASTRLRERILPLLCERSSSFFTAVTAGRYEGLLVDKSLEPRFLLQGETRENGYFSSGTRILSYLGLRLAVGRLLFREDPPPLLFDESFSCLDDIRFSRMLHGFRKLLDEGGAEQIFLFTSQKRDRTLCKEVFGESLHVQVLPGRAAPRPGE